jgi:hypothetical protein
LATSNGRDASIFQTMSGSSLTMRALTSGSCRMTKYPRPFGIEEFRRVSCAKCYELLIYVINEFVLNLNVTEDGYLKVNNQTLNPSRREDVDVIRTYMSSANEFGKWQDCCKQADLCCTNVMSLEKPKCNYNLEL